MLVISGIKTVCSLTRKGMGSKKGKDGAIQSFWDHPVVQRKSYRVIPERVNPAQFPTYWSMQKLVN